MLFSSPTFVVFFAIYFSFHLLVPHRYRIYLIVCGSTIFYAWWKLEYMWLPYLLMAIAYTGVRWIDRAPEEPARRRRIIATIIVLFTPLVVFKYANFIYVDILGLMFGVREKILDLPLPLGISFITFTLTAYVIDIVRGVYRERHGPTTVLGYVLFFPHLIAGPILRPAELLPQLEKPRQKSVLIPATAVAIFTVGLVKKLVVADPLAEVVDAAYAASSPGPFEALVAIYGFSAQIYCDFSGYTDMAIGIALLLGVRLPNNFLRPYVAQSLTEFWRRWHVTLSFWFRDYVYVPMGGNRGSLLTQVRNLLVTMALAGLWHGANWTFLIWGLLHGAGISIVHALHRLGAPIRVIPCWVSLLITFHFVTIAWIFFRAPNFQKAVIMLRAPFGDWSTALNAISENVFALVLIGVFFALHRIDDHRRIWLAARRLRREFFWPVIALGWILAITVSHGNSAKFIYFDF